MASTKMLAAWTTIAASIYAANALPTGSSPFGPSLARRQADLNEICTATNDQTLWNNQNMGGALEFSAASLAPFSQGFQATFIDGVPSIAESNYVCGMDRPCEITGVLDSACDEDPASVFVIRAMANFANFFQAVQDKVESAVTSLDLLAPSMPSTFAPNNIETQEQPDNTAVDVVGFLFSSLAALAGAIPGAQAEFAGAGLAIIGAAVPAFGSQDPEPPQEVQFQLFAGIEKAFNDARDRINDFITTFVQDNLNTTPGDGFASDPTKLVQILKDGKFAAATQDLPPVVETNMMANLAAPAISSLWNLERVGVVKIAKGSNAAFLDVCQGDNLLPADVKFCDEEGNAYMLQKFPDPSSAVSGLDFGDLSQFAVPGFENLGDFGLTAKDVMLAAERRQLADGVSITTDASGADFANSLATLNPADMTLADTLFMNIPVCIHAAPFGPSLAMRDACESRGLSGGDVNTCLFIYSNLCRCGNTSPGGFPYGYDFADCAL